MVIFTKIIQHQEGYCIFPVFEATAFFQKVIFTKTSNGTIFEATAFFHMARKIPFFITVFPHCVS